ncbi:prophage tail fiber N-terminal domain-containing protein [Salmonella enterica]|nr:prophage tail fiber N-terminal domain-containing protein [Salmonella enterica]
MPVLISGVLKDATGTPVQNCTIQLKACRTSTTVVVNTVASENPDDAGRYSMDVEQGQYTVTLLVEGYPPSHAGVITVYDDSKPGTLNDFLGAMTEDDVRPEALRRFEAMVEEVARQASEASRNATAAGQASEQAQTSAERAGASETAAKTSETQAASSAGDAGASATAAAASEKAAAASAAAAKTSETNAATSASTAAASATAASSSASEASTHAAASDTSASLAAQSSTAAGAAATRAEDAAKRAEDIADVISLEDASLTKKGIVKLSSATDSDSEALAATPKAVKTVMGEVQTKAPLDSPALTGTPTAPTPETTAAGIEIATAAFVAAKVAQLVGSAPEALDTLKELADALGNDPNFATTITNMIAGKQPLDDTLTALSGKSVDGLIEYVGLRETINSAAGAMQKSQNGGDIPDKDLFVRRIGATRAFDGAVNIGGDDNPWTTAEFISWLESCGAFNHPYWMCRGSWSYAHNKIITDTGCGNICLAGAVIEVMGVRGAMTIRVTTPTTTSGGGVASAQFTYINNGDGYSPGWRRDFNTVNKPAADEMGALSVNGGRINGALGIGTDNALGGNSIVLGDNDTGLKQNGDGILDVYANNALVARLQLGKLYVVGDVLAGDGRKLSLTSDNNSSLNARFNLWGDANRPTVIELDDDQGWHLYSQRNPDGSVMLTVNGDIMANRKLNVGAATFSSDGNINGSLWGGWLNDWINNTIINRFVQDIRLGGIEYAQAWNGPGYNDTPGYVITGVTNGNSDELIDGVHRRPLQKFIGGVWYNVASI